MFPFLRTCFPLSDSTLHAAIPSLFLSLVAFSIPTRLFHFFSITSLDPDHRHSVLLAEQNSKMQRRRQWRHSGRAALFVQRRVCWLRRKMAQVKR